MRVFFSFLIIVWRDKGGVLLKVRAMFPLSSGEEWCSHYSGVEGISIYNGVRVVFFLPWEGWYSNCMASCDTHVRKPSPVCIGGWSGVLRVIFCHHKLSNLLTQLIRMWWFSFYISCFNYFNLPKKSITVLSDLPVLTMLLACSWQFYLVTLCRSKHISVRHLLRICQACS